MDSSQHNSENDIHKIFPVPATKTNADIDEQDNKDEALQDAYSQPAPDFMEAPQEALKEGLDDIASDGSESTSSPQQDDWREQVEDLDEDHKEY